MGGRKPRHGQNYAANIMTAINIGGQVVVLQLETEHIIRAPLMTSGRLSLRANAVLLQNAGNCSLELSNGFTLVPGQSYMFGNYNELSVQKFDVLVQFLPLTATSDPVEQRLEVVQVLTNFTGSGFYIDKPPLKLN